MVQRINPESPSVREVVCQLSCNLFQPPQRSKRFPAPLLLGRGFLFLLSAADFEPCRAAVRSWSSLSDRRLSRDALPTGINCIAPTYRLPILQIPPAPVFGSFSGALTPNRAIR